MHVLPPLRRPDKPVPVVVVDGGEWPGFVTAWRGERVLAVFSKAPGVQLVRWLPADQVRGGEGFLQERRDAVVEPVDVSDRLAHQRGPEVNDVGVTIIG